MRSAYGIFFFIGVALLIAAWMWPPDPLFMQSLPMDAVSLAALWSPLFATWVMPTPRSLFIYPLAVVAMWYGAGYAGQLLPDPPPDAGYICGLPFLAMMLAGLTGIVTSVTGRALGFAVRGKINSVIATYLIQLIPFGTIAALVLMAR